MSVWLTRHDQISQLLQFVFSLTGLLPRKPGRCLCRNNDAWGGLRSVEYMLRFGFSLAVYRRVSAWCILKGSWCNFRSSGCAIYCDFDPANVFSSVRPVNMARRRSRKDSNVSLHPDTFTAVFVGFLYVSVPGCVGDDSYSCSSRPCSAFIGYSTHLSHHAPTDRPTLGLV